MAAGMSLSLSGTTSLVLTLRTHPRTLFRFYGKTMDGLSVLVGLSPTDLVLFLVIVPKSWGWRRV